MVTPVGRSSRLNDITDRGNAQLGLQQLWPHIQAYAKKYGADPKVLAGIVQQESGFKNYLVHRDGTGHGLIGLDDNGLLPSFEKWAGEHYGRGYGAKAIEPEKQIEFLAKTIGEYADKYGGSLAAARAWHRGEGAMNDSLGHNYQDLVQGHVRDLFANGGPSGGPADISGDSPGGRKSSGGARKSGEANDSAPLASGGMGAVRQHQMIREGSRGPEVSQLQAMLKKAGYDVGQGGVFDSKTDAAVRKYQQDNGLLVDGIVGQQTWGAMHGVSLPPGSSMLAGVAPYSGADGVSGSPGAGRSGGSGGSNKVAGKDWRDRFEAPALGGNVPEKMKNLLEIARRQVGTRESGWNAGAITKFTGGTTGLPWCAKFVSWAYRQAGMPLPGGDQWAVAGVKSIIQKMGQWHSDTNLKPGMAVTFSSHSHVEMIAKPVYQGGRLAGYMTIGGNTTMPGGGEGVAYKFRSLSEIEGGGYPVRV